jgi:hypothetical protein
MTATIVKILLGAGTKLVTEKFLITVTLMLLEKLAASSKNNMDDQVVAAVKEALAPKV